MEGQLAQSGKARQFARILGDWAIAYSIAVLTGAGIFLLVVGFVGNDLMILSAYPLVAPVMALFALPGFILLRTLLYWANATEAFGFAIAGMVNAILLPVIGYATGGMETPMGGEMTTMSLAAAGAVAGAVYSVVERRLLSKKGASA